MNHLREFLTTKELADLLRTRERKIYDLAANGQIPCTRATGKLLFPRESVINWLKSNQAGEQPSNVSKLLPNVFLGSHDPLLHWALQASDCGIATIFDGSMAGLNEFLKGQGIANSMHIYEPDTDSWNKHIVSTQCVNQAIVLIHFCTRTRGILFDTQKTLKPTGLSDIKNFSVVKRQATSGAQLLLEHQLYKNNIQPNCINYTDLAHNESDAALGVVNGRAEIAIGLECMAQQFSLGFIPIGSEHFDLLIDRKSWFDESFQSLWKFCQTDEFCKRANSMPGYDIQNFGQVIYNN